MVKSVKFPIDENIYKKYYYEHIIKYDFLHRWKCSPTLYGFDNIE